jgi:hypothetical protein
VVKLARSKIAILLAVAADEESPTRDALKILLLLPNKLMIVSGKLIDPF